MRHPVRTSLLLAFAIISCGIEAQELPTVSAVGVLPPSVEGPQMIPYLAAQTNQAWSFDQDRVRRWGAIRTNSELRAEQQRLRDRLLASIGGLPNERLDLRARTTGQVQMQGFRIEKLVFESLPHFYVTALVYIPDDGKAKHPAVLVPAGHAANGKIHYQELSQRLVRSGYVVLSWDPLGQGERSQFWSPGAQRSPYNLITNEHAVLGRMALLRGQSLARYEIWDGMRALDYLLSRPDVDSTRIAITGTSGGGFQAAMLGALDPRIGVVIPSCYITAMPMRVANRIFKDPDTDPEQDPPGFLSEEIDHAGLLLMMYPRPVLVAAATLDFFPIEGTRKSFNEVKELYGRFGRGGSIRMVESYNEHQYSPANQLAALRFLAEMWHLPQPVALPELTPVDPSQLLCTHSGQVIAEFPDAQPLQDLLKREPVTPVSLSSLQRLYTKTLAKGRSPVESMESRGESEYRGVIVDRYLVHFGDSLEMPLLHIRAHGAGSSHTVLMPEKTGGTVIDEQWQAIEQHLQKGDSVLLFSFRAEGENAMPYLVRGDDPVTNRGSWAKQYNNPLSSVLANLTYNAIVLGRPYLLDRIRDTEIAASFARDHLGAKALSLESGDAFFQWAAGGVLHLCPDAVHSGPSWIQDDEEPVEDTVPSVLLQGR